MSRPKSQPGKHEIYRKTRRNPGDFTTLFDWSEPEGDGVGNTDAAATLRQACRAWIEQGGLIARQQFGVNLINFGRRRDDGPLVAEYQAAKYCDPFGALLHGRSFGTGIMADAAKVLGVDEYYVVGFMHGLDGTDYGLTGRRADQFDKSKSYKAGHSAGREIADEFVRIELGWERK